VHLRRSNHAVTLWQVNLPCESLQKNFLTCDNYDSVIYGRALTVTPDGFVWQDTNYRSLSAVARAITGTSWNGRRFFGLRMKPKADQAEAGQ
jgi:Protein of unknown function (DUF2924)